MKPPAIRTRCLGGESGIALLMTITIITILVTVTLELNRYVRSAVVSTAVTRDRFILSGMASSGIHAAMAILVKDKKESTIDSIQEDWANPEKINEVLGDMPFERGSITVAIADELGKIQINALVKYPSGQNFNTVQANLWNRLLYQLIAQHESLEEVEPPTIINSIKDWIDSGDDDAITGINGAESDYYLDMEPPYSCRNGPFTCLDELAMVRGVTPDLFNGIEETVGISDQMTVYGMKKTGTGKFTFPGNININTAGLPVLSVLLPEGPEPAIAIYEYRNEMEDDNYINDLSSPTWYKQAPGCADITINPDLITLSSDIFRVVSTASLNEQKLTRTVVLYREKDAESGKWGCRVLSQQTQ